MTVTWTRRFGASPTQRSRMGTDELRAEFLAPLIIVPTEGPMCFTQVDRMVLGGIAPTDAPISIGDGAEVGTETLFQARQGGIADPAPGSIWKTMPPPTHEWPAEAYLYFEMSEEDRVMQSMGVPSETRHLVAASGEAMLSPAWSIHMGAGTGPYPFVWGMTGETRVYQDVAPVVVRDLP